MRLLRGIPPNAAWTTRLWWTRLSASLIQNEPTEHAAPFSWLCNFARIHQSLSHCLGILITEQWMQFRDYSLELGPCPTQLTHTCCHNMSQIRRVFTRSPQPAHRSWSDPESQQEGRLELVPRELYNQSGYGSTCRGPMRSNIVDGSWLFGVLNCWTFKNESAIALWILNICGLETLSHPRHWAPLSSCVAGVLAYRPVDPRWPGCKNTHQHRSCLWNPPTGHSLRLGLQLSHKLRDRWSRRWLVKHHSCWSCCIQDTLSPHRRTRAKLPSTQLPQPWPCNGTSA